MERKQFTFYESFASALRRIKKDADRAKAYDAICNYALFGELPDLDSLPDSAAIAFELIKPTLDASAKKAKSGKSGGETKQTESKPQANAKQTKSKPQANAKQTKREKEGEKEKEVEGEIEIEKENECYILPSEERKDKKEIPSALHAEKRKIGKYVELTVAEYAELIRDLGTAEFGARRKAVDIPENEGKDFYALIRGAG